jgi:alkylhydroperoxidase family enzyme
MFVKAYLLPLVLGMTCAMAANKPSQAAAPPAQQRFSMLGQEETWNRLPRATPRLPNWARALAPSMPKTTAAMLQLDYLHRAKNPLGKVQASKLRWIAADAVQCNYGRRYAEADLRRGGWSDNQVRDFPGDLDRLAPGERALLTFARKLTLAGHSITDAEFKELLGHFGAETVTAIVHTIAYANFQNRIFLSLKVAVEPGGPVAPIEAGLDPSKEAKVAAPARPLWKAARLTKPLDLKETAPVWGERDYDNLQKALENQKSRSLRIPLPGPERLSKVPAAAKGEASRVVWTNISMGYQPVMTKTWFDCMRTFHGEARLDRVFGNTMFWVITRSNECFY